MTDFRHDQPIQPERGIIAWFGENHVAANILMLFLIIGGILSIAAMRSETFPSIDPKQINITVPYPGATPSEVADSITSRVEESLQGIDGVKRVTSTASEGIGVVSVELEDFADGEQVYNDVETAVNGLSAFPPEDAERPTISRLRATPNVLTLAIYGDVDEHGLRYWSDFIDDELKGIDGVALTSIRGIRDYEISIEVSEKKLREHNLRFDEVANTVTRFSSDIPAGTLESPQGEIRLRVEERRYTGPEFEAIALRTLPDGSILRLGEVAQVVDGFEDVNLASRFKGKPAAFIEVRRSENEDTIKVSELVKDYLETLSLPAGLSLEISSDETVVLRDRISLMLRNAVLGFALVFIILLLFLDLKLAVWTSAAIPISFLGGTMILHFMGYSLNMISLFALIVVLGIVVDDGIVTGESIFEEQSKRPGDKSATLRGVRAVLAPVTVGVTTTMAAFAPLLFSTGTLGQIIGVIPAVVIPILFVSLIEAYFILPAHLSSPKRWSRGILASLRNFVAERLERFTDTVIDPVIRFTVSWRYATIACFFAVAILTISLVTNGHVRFIFFPAIESDQIGISLQMPVGTPFQTTVETVEKIEEAIAEVQAEIDTERGQSPFESVSVTLGSQSNSDGGAPGITGSDDTGSNLAGITIRLLPSDFRNVSSKQIENMIRDRTETLPGIEELTFTSSLAGSEPDIEIDLAHPNESVLIQAAKTLEDKLTQLKGTTNISNSFKSGKKEILFELSEEGYAVGLTPEDLGRDLRSGFFGFEAQRIQRGTSEVIVYIRYPKSDRESLTSLDDTRIRLGNGTEVPLSSVTRQVEQIGFSQIESVDGRRVVTLLADADTRITTPNEILGVLETDVLPDILLQFPGLSYNFSGETRDQRDDLASLGSNMLIAILIIYIILGGQLRSYVQPLIIMAAVPFGVAGAILGHFFLGYDLTFISLFGMVALTGVVVNDSVVLMDFLNTKRLEGATIVESAVLAVRRRFRPILLTTLSTCLGLLPMLLETSMQARFLIPMVVSLATGILFVTPIVLILVPSVVVAYEDLKRIGARLFI
ncbi:MAG: efflux RND transporter permease subunit [Verrucomicrobiota bacterium]